MTGAGATAPQPDGQADVAAARAATTPEPAVEITTRDDVGRVIGRALHHEPVAESVETDQDVLRAVARELDVAPEHLALAVVEERASGDSGIIARVVGPSTVAAHRVVLVDESLADRAEHWLERGHGLRVIAVEGDQIRAVRRTDKLGKLNASMKSAGGAGRLNRFRGTTVRTASVDDRSAVGVEVDLIDQRGRSVLNGAAAGTAGLGVVLLGTVIVSPIAAAAAPLAVVGGAAVARSSFRKQRELAEAEAEQMADGLARNQRPPRLFDEVESRLRGMSQRRLRQGSDDTT